MQAGVKNKFIGKITAIKSDEIMSQVTVQVGENTITSVMTTDSLHEAGFKEGDTVTALTKAIHVVLIK